MSIIKKIMTQLRTHLVTTCVKLFISEIKVNKIIKKCFKKETSRGIMVTKFIAPKRVVYAIFFAFYLDCFSVCMYVCILCLYYQSLSSHYNLAKRKDVLDFNRILCTDKFLILSKFSITLHEQIFFI